MHPPDALLPMLGHSKLQRDEAPFSAEVRSAVPLEPEDFCGSVNRLLIISCKNAKTARARRQSSDWYVNPSESNSSALPDSHTG